MGGGHHKQYFLNTLVKFIHTNHLSYDNLLHRLQRRRHVKCPDDNFFRTLAVTESTACAEGGAANEALCLEQLCASMG